MPHASLTIQIQEEDLLSTTNSAIIRIQGCKDCLIQTITKALLIDVEFKNLINTAVRAENEQRQKTQN